MGRVTSRIRRRRTYVVWLSLFHPGASEGLLTQWRAWLDHLEETRRPVPIDLVAHPPRDLGLSGFSLADMREGGWLWIGIVRWRDRRDLYDELGRILQGIPQHPDAHWIWVNVTEGPEVVYRGSAEALAAAAFFWTC